MVFTLDTLYIVTTAKKGESLSPFPRATKQG